ncbi:hypothetical protein EJ04DRAFT_512465 [Polyplosphaeria fusca]|uniref:FAR-17a/AIG1-like protein n=1 Tax=Polyplosphaeria fusca TaxID=682080 RepID=A0A9P4R0I2_9PLEO|nr:hypothetical protein EJ04DRAFT_512465 [Polyplosphaeria fusca]
MQFFSYAAYGIAPTGFDTQKTFVRSPFISPLTLACLRALIAVYCFSALIVCYSYLAHHTTTNTLQDVNIDSYTLVTGYAGIGQSLSFFTYLTYWSLGFYFLASSVHTFCYALRGRTWLHSWPRPLQLAHSAYYTSVVCFPWLVSIVFWGTMYSGPWPKQRFVQWINISVHGLNSVFALFEVTVPTTRPFPWTHLSFLITVLSVYLGLAYLTRLTGGFYVYEWMNPAHGAAGIVIHILCYTVAMVAIFFLVMGAIRLRDYLTNSDRKDEGEGKMMKLEDGSAFSISSKVGSTSTVSV